MTGVKPDAHEGHEGCHYLPNALAVRPEDADEAGRYLGVDRLDPEAFGELWERLGDEADEVRELIPLLQVEDPHRAAAILAHRERPIDASPIHGVGFLSHGGFMSGPGPDTCKADLSVPDADTDSNVIAVVDSGIVEEDERPDYLRGANVVAFDADEEVGTPSHGTFVAGVIRLTNPASVVSLAAAHPDTGLLVTDGPGTDVADPPTTELDVLGAIVRLVRRHGDKPHEVKALNLSLGASACTSNDGFLLTLREAIAYWRTHMGLNAPIFAAGGNSDDPDPVYPAALDCVRGVAALNENSEQVVWRRTPNSVLTPEKPNARWWITDEAPGTDVRGPIAAGPDGVVCWSGSSFATAIATAQSTKGAAFTVRNGITRWSN